MRAKRQQSPIDIYHATSRGTGQQRIFEDDEDRGRFLEILSSRIAKGDVSLLAWCLMDNHVHLLFQGTLPNLSRLMRCVLADYAVWFNGKADRTGHLFQGRFWSEPIQDERQLMTVIRYIHDNPAAANMGETASYPWSSYREYVEAPVYCETSFFLGIIGGVDAFVSLHEEYGPYEQHLEPFQTKRRPRAMSDKDAEVATRALLEGKSLNDLKTLDKTTRNRLLREIKGLGIPIRQIVRLTGIGRGIIQRA